MTLVMNIAKKFLRKVAKKGEEDRIISLLTESLETSRDNGGGGFFIMRTRECVSPST